MDFTNFVKTHDKSDSWLKLFGGIGTWMVKVGQGRRWQGREGLWRAIKGREGQGRAGKGREGQGRAGKGRDVKCWQGRQYRQGPSSGDLPAFWKGLNLTLFYNFYQSLMNSMLIDWKYLERWGHKLQLAKPDREGLVWSGLVWSGLATLYVLYISILTICITCWGFWWEWGCKGSLAVHIQFLSWSRNKK